MTSWSPKYQAPLLSIFFGGEGWAGTLNSFGNISENIFEEEGGSVKMKKNHPCFISLHNIEGSDGDGHQMKPT